MSSDGYHEPFETLGPHVRDRHRAISSLQEELDAVDWYEQRVEAIDDPDLRDILVHNRDEEKEHAAMLLEWLRRQDDVFDAMLREYLFADGAIAGREAGPAGAGEADGNASLGIGSLRQREDVDQ